MQQNSEVRRMMYDIDSWFSRDYTQARERFRTATRCLEHGAIEVSDELTIDWGVVRRL